MIRCDKCGTELPERKDRHWLIDSGNSDPNNEDAYVYCEKCYAIALEVMAQHGFFKRPESW